MYSKENKNYHNDLNHSILPEGTETGEITIHLWVVLSTSLCCSGQVVPYRSDLSVHLDVTQRTWAKRGSCYRKWERPVVTWADSSDERESLKRRRCEFKSLENTHGLVVKIVFLSTQRRLFACFWIVVRVTRRSGLVVMSVSGLVSVALFLLGATGESCGYKCFFFFSAWGQSTLKCLFCAQFNTTITTLAAIHPPFFKD